MVKKNFVVLVVWLSLLVFMSCAHAPAGLAPYSSPIEESEMSVLGHATGKVTYFSLLGIFPFGKPDYNAAIRDAVGKVNGGGKLINVRSIFTSTWVVVGFIHTLEVEGDVVR